MLMVIAAVCVGMSVLAGLPLRWIEGDEDGDEDGGAVEYRDICPLNEEGPPLDILGEADCFTLGPFEAQLAALQIRQTGGELRRIGLRELLVTTAR